MKGLMFFIQLFPLFLLCGRGYGLEAKFPPDPYNPFPREEKLSFQLSGGILSVVVDNVQIGIGFKDSSKGSFDSTLVFNTFNIQVKNGNADEAFIQIKTEKGDPLKRFIVNSERSFETDFTFLGSEGKAPIIISVSFLEKNKKFTALADLSSLLTPIASVATSESLISEVSSSIGTGYRIESLRVVSSTEEFGYRIESLRVVEESEEKK